MAESMVERRGRLEREAFQWLKLAQSAPNKSTRMAYERNARKTDREAQRLAALTPQGEG